MGRIVLRIATAGCALGPLLAGAFAPAVASDARLGYRVPFACGASWFGDTRASHSPSSKAIDFQRPDALGKPVVAAAPGIVTTATYLGDRSYGRYVVIDHGDGRDTLYAHLQARYVVVGQWVDQGQAIGRVGATGNASGAHLHFEQRLQRSDESAWFDGERYRYHTTIRSRNCAGVPLAGDWNADLVSDVGVFGRGADGGVFRLVNPDGSRTVFHLGTSLDEPVTGDWNGDGHTDIGVWNRPTGSFVLAAGRARTSITLGDSNDQPLVGDWDGDGRTDVGVWDPGTLRFTLRSGTGYRSTYTFGSTRSIAVAGDWDGDGRFDIGAYDPVTSAYSLRNADGTTTAVRFGSAGSLPLVAHWNADTRSDLGVWDPASATLRERLRPGRYVDVRFGSTRWAYRPATAP